MSLASALPLYKTSIVSVFGNSGNTAPGAGSDIGSATKDWAISGVPMTSHTGTLAPGQAVAGFVTSSPGAVSGTGLGGIDSASPGAGLSAVKTVLIADLTTLFQNINNTPVAAADGFTQAVNSFFSAAKIMTNFTGVMPPGAAVPGPAGPVGVGTYTGAAETGGVDSPSGSGFSATLTPFQSSLTSTFSNTANTAPVAAQGIADACETFFLSAMVSMTSSTGTAGGGPAVVAVPAGTGSTGPLGSPIISGSGTGTLS